jgi:hypothetical protein
MEISNIHLFVEESHLSNEVLLSIGSREIFLAGRIEFSFPSLNHSHTHGTIGNNTAPSGSTSNLMKELCVQVKSDFIVDKIFHCLLQFLGFPRF